MSRVSSKCQKYYFVCFTRLITYGQLFKRSLSGVWQTPALLTKLSHFQFAERFYVNTIYREQFHESIWRQLEKHLSS